MADAGTGNVTGGAPRSPVRRWLSNLSLLNKSRLIILILLALFVGACGAFLKAQDHESRAREWTLHTYQVLSTADRSVAILLDMRRLLRDGLVNSDPSRISVYGAQSDRYDAVFKELKNLVRDNPAQSQRARRVEQLKAVWNDRFAKPSIERIRSPQGQTTRADDDFLEALNGGDASLSAVQDELTALIVEEQGLLRLRIDALDNATQMARNVVLGALVMGLLGSLYGMIAARRTVAEPLIRLTQLIPRISTAVDVGPIPYRWRRDEVGGFARSLGELSHLVREREADRWLQTGLSRLADDLRRADSIDAFGDALLRALCPALDAAGGAAYSWDAEAETLRVCAVFGVPPAGVENQGFMSGEGGIGRCIAEAIQERDRGDMAAYHQRLQALRERLARYGCPDGTRKALENLATFEAASVDWDAGTRKSSRAFSSQMMQTSSYYEPKMRDEQLRRAKRKPPEPPKEGA